MLSLIDISIQFGERILFKNVSFSISPHDRIGLVGSNGTGKTTLLKIIAGQIQPDNGRIEKARYVTIGYLPQDGVIASGKTLYKEVETSFEDIINVQQKISEAHTLLASLTPESMEYNEVLEIYGELQHKLEDLDAFRMKSKIERILMGLGFSIEEFSKRTEEFSGGWQMRIALAKLLLREPSVLLLDEPTNHLDLISLQWLEEYLQNYNGAIILVSHDRAFLDSITKKTFELGMGNFSIYMGNYSSYENEKKIRKENLLNKYKNQQKEIAKTERFIERFRYKATKARQVQSRIKMLEKIEQIEVGNDEEEIHFKFPQPIQSGSIVIELKNIFKSYDNIRLFENLNYTIERGDKIAVVGANGSGKSTFVRILAGYEPFQAGERKIGYNVISSYFCQHQAEELDFSKEVIQIIDEVAVGEIRTKIRKILGAFLFHDDDVFKKVSVLSGGEKSRLALAKMLLQPANFLIMDEPTNHLDMRSKKVLQDALNDFEGTFVIVSHDRAFLDTLVNKVIEFDKGKLKTYIGNISDYINKKKEQCTDSATALVEKQSRLTKFQISEKDRKHIEAERRNKIYKLIFPYKQQLQLLENDISKLESRKAEIENMMTNPDFYKNENEAKTISKEYKSIQLNLEKMYLLWDELIQKIEEIKSLP